MEKQRKNSNDLYYTSTISVPIDEMEHYKGLTIEENTQLVDFIYDKVKNNPDDIKKKPLHKAIINFKFRKSHTEIFKEMMVLLKKNNVSFSSLFRKYYTMLKRRNHE